MEYSRRSYALLAIDRRGPIVKKAISALVSLLLGGAVALSFAGCTTQNTAGGTVSNSEAHRGLVSNSELAAGIVKNDPYTWFEAEKAVLPSRTDCEKIALGMTLNAVIRAIGKPQRDIGYGASVFQFDVADGSVFTVRFAPDLGTDPSLPSYDRLVVAATDFGTAVPELYFPQQVVFSTLYPWMAELDMADITEVRYEAAAIGVAPYRHYRDIAYSEAQADIEGAYRLLSSPLHAIAEEEGMIDGGGYVQYDFITAEKTYSVTLSNQTVFLDGKYYRFDGALYKFASPSTTCQAFITYIEEDPFEIYTYAEQSEKVGEFQGLGKFEFRAYEGILENTPKYVLKTAGEVELLILSARQFMIKGDANTVIYQLTSPADFSFLFPAAEE